MHPIVEKMLAQGEQIPKALHDELLEHIEEVTPSLLTLLEDQSYWEENESGEGFGPLHAVDILVEAGVSAAIAPMIECLFALDTDTYLYNKIVIEMPKLGEVVIEPCLATMGLDVVTPERLKDLDPTHTAVIGLSNILASCGTKDERIFELLIHNTQEDPITCFNLGAYGDPRAIPVLTDILERWSIATSKDSDLFAPTELEDAIQRLGGSLTDAQRDKVKGAQKASKDLFKRSHTTATKPFTQPKPKPNEKCWCNSGKKYKKCHMTEDEKR